MSSTPFTDGKRSTPIFSYRKPLIQEQTQYFGFPSFLFTKCSGPSTLTSPEDPSSLVVHFFLWVVVDGDLGLDVEGHQGQRLPFLVDLSH